MEVAEEGEVATEVVPGTPAVPRATVEPMNQAQAAETAPMTLTSNDHN